VIIHRRQPVVSENQKSETAKRFDFPATSHNKLFDSKLVKTELAKNKKEKDQQKCIGWKKITSGKSFTAIGR